MANPVNSIDLTGQDLTTYLATVVSDGTNNSIFTTEKTDDVDVPASQIAQRFGARWGNRVDDFVKTAYPLVRQVHLGLIASSGAIGAIEMIEAAATPGSGIAAGRGRYWVKNTVPSTPWFADDTGAEYQVGLPASSSLHSVRGSTARGSTNTQIYRWTSVVDNTGSPDITYSDSATLGGRWTVATAGIYSVSVSIDAGHAGYVAIKADSSVSNTFDQATIRVAVESAVGITATLSWTGYLLANDLVWIASSSATNPTGTPVNNNRVTVARIR